MYGYRIIFKEGNIKDREINKKCQKLPIVKTQEVNYLCEIANGVICIGSYDYPESVINWHKMFYELELIDLNYGNNFEIIRNKKIETLSRNEILTKITFILRGEHFGTGELALEIKNGNLEKLTKRLNKLTKF